MAESVASCGDLRKDLASMRRDALHIDGGFRLWMWQTVKQANGKHLFVEAVAG